MAEAVALEHLAGFDAQLAGYYRCGLSFLPDAPDLCVIRLRHFGERLGAGTAERAAHLSRTVHDLLPQFRHETARRLERERYEAKLLPRLKRCGESYRERVVEFLVDVVLVFFFRIVTLLLLALVLGFGPFIMRKLLKMW